MRVSCPECGAEYQFSSQAIPPEGYDAQCTNCSTVFFVAQEVTHPRIKIDLDRVVTIGCPSCDAQYQFPARDIPPGGYDAECNKCHAVFFVSDDEGAAERYQMIGSPDPVEEPQPDLQLPEHGTSDVISADTQPNGELPEDTSPNAELPATDDLDDTASDVTVDTSPNAQMPEPDPLDGVADLTDADPSDEEFEESDSEVTEQQTMKVRLRDDEREALQDDEPEELTDAEFEEIPEADSSLLEDITGIDPFDDSLTVPEPPLPESVAVQQPVRRQTAPNPVMPEPIETDRVAAFDGVDDDLDIDFGTHRGTKGLVVAAIAAMALAVAVGWYVMTADPASSDEFLSSVSRGRMALRSDTDSGYQTAISEFRKALDVAPGNAEAAALLGLAKILRGTNVEERGQFMVDYGKRLNRQLKELNGGSKKKAAELAKEIKTLSAESTALFQTGQRNISDGFESLRLALQTDATHPVVLEVASLYYSISKDNLSESKDLAHEGLVHRGLDPETFDWKQPPSPWSGIAMSEVQAGLESDEQTATAILRSLVQEDPRFHRARFELAQMYMTLERAEMARAEVDAVLALESDHERAAVWIEHLNRSMPGAGDPDAPAVASAQAPDMTEETAGGEAVADSDDSKKKKKKRPRKKRRRKKR